MSGLLQKVKEIIDVKNILQIAKAFLEVPTAVLDSQVYAHLPFWVLTSEEETPKSRGGDQQY